MDESLIFNGLVDEVRQLIDKAKQKVAVAVNAELTLLYWHIGRCIQAELLKGQRAEYGKQVIKTLSEQLTQLYGRGWGTRHLWNCLRFTEQFPDLAIVNTVCAQLSWSHLRLLSSMDDTLKRDFYIEIAQLERWSFRQLKSVSTRCCMSVRPYLGNLMTQSGKTSLNYVTSRKFHLTFYFATRTF